MSAVPLSSLALGVGESARFNTFFYFATAVATGIALTLPLIPVEQVGRRFFILLSLIAIVFSTLALASNGLEIGYFHVACAGLLIAYNVIVPSQTGPDRSLRREAAEGRTRPILVFAARALLVIAAACGVAGVLGDALRYPASLGFPGAQAPWIAAAFLSSTALLGASATAMVLGHWYLVVRHLSFRPLERLTMALLITIGLRTIVAAATAFAQGRLWEASYNDRGPVGFFIGPGIFVLARAVFGILGPAALAWMTWKCVRIQSNQSATGILYVVVAFVLIGELIAKWFLVNEGLVL